MRAYVGTTGILFLGLAAAHVLRILKEQHLARDPWFMLATIIALGFAAWALRLYRTRADPERSAP